MKSVLSVILLLAVPGTFQDNKKQEPARAHPKVDQKRVDEAIKRGIAYLKSIDSPISHQEQFRKIDNTSELILWTFIHAGVSEKDPKFQQLLKVVLEAPLERTYKVSLRAMILEELDRVKYQSRILQCAQFLVDNQCKNGQWGYGEPTPTVPDVPTEGSKRQDVPTSSTGGKAKLKEDDPETPATQRKKPKVVRKIAVQKKREGPATGDNSNSQYAALGLRACHDAGIVLPLSTILSATKAWEMSAHADGGKGWCYCFDGHQPYGSMTAGGVGSLVIYHYLLGQDWRKDKLISEGLEWMARHFTVTSNPGTYEHVPKGGANTPYHYYYYLYALERAFILYGTEKIGPHEWYVEGAEVLLRDQKNDGAWDAMTGGSPTIFSRVWDTCFAILFLRRATRPLQDVATEDSRSPGDHK